MRRGSVLKMNIKLIIFVICALIEAIYGDELSCADERKLGNTCGKYCYRIVKPLLQHLAKMSIKEQEFENLLKKVHEQEIIIKNLQLENARFENQTPLLSACKSELAAKDALIEYRKADIKSLESDIQDCKFHARANIFRLEEQLKTKDNSIDPKVSSCSTSSSDIEEAKVYNIKSFAVSCDSRLAGSGWTVIQRRQDGSVDFNRKWNEYRLGFGQIQGEFFMGLEKLHLLTSSQPHELYIYLRNIANETRFARYDYFLIADETESFRLQSLGNYTGNAGHSLFSHVGSKFSTMDRDNDSSDFNCATEWLSGWWYKSCYDCNLNGVYKDVSNNDGIKWLTWNTTSSISFVQMMIRPKSL